MRSEIFALHLLSSAPIRATTVKRAYGSGPVATSCRPGWADYSSGSSSQVPGSARRAARVKLERPQPRSKAAKLRVWRVCRGCLIGWRVEAVSAEAGAGEEAEAGPLGELGEQVAGFYARSRASSRPVQSWPGWLVMMRGDPFSAGWAGGRGRAVGSRGGAGRAGGPRGGTRMVICTGVIGRQGRSGRLVVADVVAGGGAFDLAGAVARAAGGQQVGQDGTADPAGQVAWVVRSPRRRGRR